MTAVGSRGMTGRHGNHRRGPKVERVAITCEVCGVTRLWTPSQARRRTGRFCSQACAGKAKDSRITVPCAQCGTETLKRPTAAGRRVFCSPACVAASRRVPGARWKDSNQIKEYMRGYVAKNRARHNAKGAEWARNNRGKRNELQRMRRAAYTGGLTEAEWQAIKRAHGFRCLRCLKPESLLLQLTPDHVVAVSRGGAHEPANIQPLCGPCNSWKGARTIDYRESA